MNQGCEDAMDIVLQRHIASKSSTADQLAEEKGPLEERFRSAAIGVVARVSNPGRI